MTTHHTEPTGDTAESQEGSSIGPYRLLTQLGSGAMGRVFLAVDPTGRQAAVKVVRSELAEVPAFLKRFARELDVAQRVHGSHVADVYDGQADGPRPWLATEYVPGPTLQEAIEQGGCFDNARLRAFAAAVADALKSIHETDVVHRDLKPSNILLGADGPKVIDFGVARAIDASLLTNTGQTLGTPAYMSPEQADGRMVQSASDVFALGALLVFAATGRLAFGDGPPLAILHRVVNNDPDLDGVAEDDPELRALVEKCLAKEPDDRPTPEQLIETLGEAPWEPLAGVEWQQPPLGIGLPLTVNDAADTPTVALSPAAKRGKRIALISAATVAALALAIVAVVEGVGDKKSPTAKTSSKVGDPLSGADPVGGAFPTDGTTSSSTSEGQTPTNTSPSSSSAPPAAPVNPGGPPAPSSGTSTSVVVGQVPVGGGGTTTVTTGRGSTAPSTSKSTAPASKSSSKPAPPPSTTQPPAPAHNPPAPLPGSEVRVDIPGWFGTATVNVSWVAHSDATSYDVHYTNNFASGTDKTVNVGNQTAYSFSAPAGSVSCVQVRPLNQYGAATWTPTPMYCFDTSGNRVS